MCVAGLCLSRARRCEWVQTHAAHARHIRREASRDSSGEYDRRPDLSVTPFAGRDALCFSEGDSGLDEEPQEPEEEVDVDGDSAGDGDECVFGFLFSVCARVVPPL